MYSIIQNRSKGSIHKPAKFIAPGHLSKARVYGPKTSRIDGNSNSHSTSSGTSLQFKDQEHLYTSNHKVDGISTHTLIVDFGEHQLKESDFTEDSSMLDILKMCKKFIDVNSVGYKVMNGDGRPLRNDRDVLDMFKEHEFVENIDVYVEFDDAAKLLPFKLPDDSSTIGSLNFAKPFPFKLPEDSSTIDSSSQKARNVRGKNKNKKVARLKSGEKLEVEFYNNRAVGKYHTSWSRHLEKIVRNKHVCPVLVQTWKEITELEKEHMWCVVKEYFSYPKMELYREHTLEHMHILWTTWRSIKFMWFPTKQNTKL